MVRRQNEVDQHKDVDEEEADEGKDATEAVRLQPQREGHHDEVVGRVSEVGRQRTQEEAGRRKGSGLRCGCGGGVAGDDVWCD